MAGNLFNGESILTYRDQQIAFAENQVKALTEQQLFNPALAGILEKIANASIFEVATLRSEQKRGKNRTVIREQVRHGLAMNVERKLLDIMIPYVGSEKSFRYSPTTCNIIYDEVSLGKDALVLTLNDDEHVDRCLGPFIERVSANLDHLRKDMNALSDAIRANIRAVAERRQNEIKATKERNKTRHFPID